MKYVLTFVGSLVGGYFGLMWLVESDRTIPAEELLAYQVGSGAIALFLAFGITIGFAMSRS